MTLAAIFRGQPFSVRLTAATIGVVLLTSAIAGIGSSPWLAAPAGAVIAILVMRTMTREIEDRVLDNGGPAGRPRGYGVDTPSPGTGATGAMLFPLAFEASPVGMIVTDPGGVILLVNRQAERMFGYEREELVGRPIDILVPQRLRATHAIWRAAFSRRPEIRQIGPGRDLSAVRKDGTEFPVEIGLNPVGSRHLVLAVIADISERKRTERLKDEFVSMVSHELRTPLTSISGSLGLLAGKAAGDLPEPAMRLLAIAHKNIQRLVRLINDILEIEKFESGELVFDMKRVEIRPLVEQAIEATRGYTQSRGVTVELDPAAVTCDVRADPDRLVQVVTNLLSNAIKFSPPDGAVNVTIALRGDRVRLEVRDRGPGIPEAFKARIYQKFAQADGSAASPKGGSGLGLSIVKSIVTHLAGTTGFANAPDGGTIFYVELPVLAANRENAAAADGAALQRDLAEEVREA
jgi:PAS domain S-box-containing protein